MKLVGHQCQGLRLLQHPSMYVWCQTVYLACSSSRMLHVYFAVGTTWARRLVVDVLEQVLHSAMIVASLACMHPLNIAIKTAHCSILPSRRHIVS
eukprot:2294964-Amphidinium_carterae.6